MERKERYLDPGLHPAHILFALKLFVDAIKARNSLPVLPGNVGACTGVFNHGKWQDGSKGFGCVLGAYTPCRIHVTPDVPHPWIQVDSAAFDAYYGPGSCYRALDNYLRRRMAGITSAQVADADPLDGIPLMMPGELPGRRGEKKARKTAEKSGSGIGVMNAIAGLEALVAGHTETDSDTAPPLILPDPQPLPEPEWRAFPPKERAAAHATWMQSILGKRPMAPADLVAPDAGPAADMQDTAPEQSVFDPFAGLLDLGMDSVVDSVPVDDDPPLTARPESGPVVPAKDAERFVFLDKALGLSHPHPWPVGSHLGRLGRYLGMIERHEVGSGVAGYRVHEPARVTNGGATVKEQHIWYACEGDFLSLRSLPEVAEPADADTVSESDFFDALDALLT